MSGHVEMNILNSKIKILNDKFFPEHQNAITVGRPVKQLCYTKLSKTNVEPTSVRISPDSSTLEKKKRSRSFTFSRE